MRSNPYPRITELETIRTANYCYEWQYSHRSVCELGLELWRRLNAGPVYDAQRRRIGMYGLRRYVTESYF